MITIMTFLQHNHNDNITCLNLRHYTLLYIFIIRICKKSFFLFLIIFVTRSLNKCKELIMAQFVVNTS